MSSSAVFLMMASTQQSDVSRPTLWFGLLGGGVAWTAHLVVAYVVAEFGCVGGLGSRSFAGLSWVAWLEIAITALTTIVAAAATAVARRSQRIIATRAEDQLAAAFEAHTARAGVLTSGLFTIIILFESIPILFYLRDC